MDNFPSCRGHIVAEVDVERMRREARALATHAGFDRHGAEAILLAVSELATNLVRYAPGGELVVSIVSEANGVGILIQSSDPGPGIPMSSWRSATAIAPAADLAAVYPAYAA